MICNALITISNDNPKHKILEGGVAAVGVFLDSPQDGQPTGEPIGLYFFLTNGYGAPQLDGIEEPYIIDWVDWKTMRLKDSIGSRLIYEADDGMSCNIETDLLPIKAPETVYAALGHLRQAGFAGDTAPADQIRI